MPTPITIGIGDVSLSGDLNDSPTALVLTTLLPLAFSMTRWGDEFYGDCGISVELSEDARDVMEVGELAVWPAGNALCIFFGPTPASRGDEPRAVSPVNPIGKLIDSTDSLKDLGDSIHVTIERS